MIYTRSNHAKYRLQYHVILVCKYRKHLLVKHGDIVKRLIHELIPNITEIEVDQDHVHLLVHLPPTRSISDQIKRIKQHTTYNLYKIPEIKKDLNAHFWKRNKFWSEGYFVSTIGDVSEETIKRYIIEQG